jgi:riboflavin synthase
MFTGLIEAIGTVRGARVVQAGRRIEVDLGPLAEGVRVGDSINVAGCCQTVAEMRGSSAAFDAVPETLRLTTLGDLAAGDRVNLERSLVAGARLGGHFVTGHVDGAARLADPGAPGEQGGARLWVFQAEPALLRQMVPKGSVAVDGVSLTLVDVADAAFSVALIPTTLERTTLGRLRAGDRVNVETDLLGKYVLRYLGTAAAGGLTVEKLRDAGFID